MQKLRGLTMGVILVWIGFVGSACAGSGSDQTASQLAAVGKTVFQQYCTTCHGDDGQKVNGSALMGPDNVLATYQNGQELYDFIHNKMPDDNPGSLTLTQTLQVESYLLLQGGYVQPSTPIHPDQLDQIMIKSSP